MIFMAIYRIELIKEDLEKNVEVNTKSQWGLRRELDKYIEDGYVVKKIWCHIQLKDKEKEKGIVKYNDWKEKIVGCPHCFKNIKILTPAHINPKGSTDLGYCCQRCNEQFSVYFYIKNDRIEFEVREDPGKRGRETKIVFKDGEEIREEIHPVVGLHNLYKRINELIQQNVFIDAWSSVPIEDI